MTSRLYAIAALLGIAGLLAGCEQGRGLRHLLGLEGRAPDAFLVAPLPNLETPPDLFLRAPGRADNSRAREEISAQVARALLGSSPKTGPGPSAAEKAWLALAGVETLFLNRAREDWDAWSATATTPQRLDAILRAVAAMPSPEDSDVVLDPQTAAARAPSRSPSPRLAPRVEDSLNALLASLASRP